MTRAAGQADRGAAGHSPDTRGRPGDDRPSGNVSEDAGRHLVQQAR